MPSASPISVRFTAHRSSSPYQSRLLRARRDTSRPKTMPARPSATSATRRSKPVRSTLPLADVPRSWSITMMRSSCQPKLSCAHLQFVLPLLALEVMLNLVLRRLPNVDVCTPRELVRLNLRMFHLSPPRSKVVVEQPELATKQTARSLSYVPTRASVSTADSSCPQCCRTFPIASACRD